MTQKVVKRRRGWRRRTIVSIFASLITVIALLYWEQAAVLYVVSTLAVCVLLFLVAFADLEGRDREMSQRIHAEPQGVSKESR